MLAERSRIARELHDTLIQGFSGVTMEMQALAARLASEHRRTLEDIIQDAGTLPAGGRRSVADLRGCMRPDPDWLPRSPMPRSRLTETRESV